MSVTSTRNYPIFKSYKGYEKWAFNQDSRDNLITMIKAGHNLKYIIQDDDPITRAIVAECGQCLDKLINDPDYLVRRAVAQRGYGLDKLINDSNKYVREMAKSVQEHGPVIFMY